MKLRRKIISLALAAAVGLSLAISAFAAVGDTGFSDVDAGSWYADAVGYVRDNGLMSGTSDTTFSPDDTMTRAMLATVLYRMAGSPAVSGTSSFLDVPAGAWYEDAALWAAQDGIISGYGSGLFGSNDPVTREQIAVILWRYAGSPSAADSQDFADEADISGWAAQAVDWARTNGIINGRAGNRFEPGISATRAEVATILSNYAQTEQEGPSGSEERNILVAYFSVPETDGADAVASASRVVENGQVMGNVEFIAQAIQEETGGDPFAIETVQTYPGTHEELLAFAAAEGEANARPELSTHLDDLDEYDVIFLGYPIWNADLPMPMYTFLDTYDLSGKTIIPFTAHGGSGFAGTIRTLAAEEPGAQVESNGFSVSRNSVAGARDDVTAWVAELGYTQSQPQTPSQPDSSAEPDVLVAYFSQTGNTEEVAQLIAEQTGGDLAEIQRAEPYEDLQTEAQAEIDNGTQPEITVDVDSLDGYEVIFIGYPIWWDEAPAMISTFLASYDFDGKIVAPFCTSAYSPIDNSLHIFEEQIPDATLADGLTANSLSEVAPWVDEVLALRAA